MRISDKDDLCEVREAMKLVIANYRSFLSFLCARRGGGAGFNKGVLSNSYMVNPDLRAPLLV
jgi:hypothetical protein